MDKIVFTPHFLNTHRQSGSKLSAGAWYHHVGRKMNTFKNPANVFRPVALNIRTATDTMGGTTRMMVNATDDAWYTDLTTELASMLNVPKHVTLKVQTPMGLEIAGMSPARLHKVGELQVVDKNSGSPVYTQRTAEPPKRLTINKGTDLHEWYTDDLRDGLVQVVRQTLTNKSEHEIDRLLKGGEIVQQKMAQFIEDSVPDWETFLDTYAFDDLARDINLDDTHETAMKISEGFLRRLRAGIRANAPHIRTFYAQKAAKQHEDGPLLGQHVATTVTKYHDDGMMWQDIAEDVFYSGRTASIASTIVKQGFRRFSDIEARARRRGGRRARRSKARRGKKAPLRHHKVPGMPRAKRGYLHPMGDKKDHTPMAECVGLEVPNEAFLCGETTYSGDQTRAMQHYHMFSHQFAYPQIESTMPIDHVESSMPELIPIDHVESSMPELIPIDHVESSMPELIPIDHVESSMPELIPIDHVESSMPELIPIDHVESSMPELIPIDHVESSMPELIPIDHVESSMPELIPIDHVESSMPELIPIDHVESSMPELIPIDHVESSMPELIPLNDLVLSDEEAQDTLESGLFVDNLPDLDDFL